MKSLGHTVPKDQLITDAVYRIYHNGRKDDLAVFCHVGQTGMPIFHPLGEPSFQDVFGLEGYGTTNGEGVPKWVAIFERFGTPEDKGY
jgi:hypothetical protein